MTINKATIIQTAAPDYRKRIFDFLSQETGIDFKLYTGDSYFETSIKTAIKQDYCKLVKNVFFFKRKFLFQFGIWKPVFKSDVLVIEMNPRIISNWLILIIRKILHKKTVVWGHAWPRKGSKSKSDKVRNLMRLLADEIIVYTKQQSVELQRKMPKKTIKYAANALYYEQEMQAPSDLKKETCNNIIYVGRLTKQKKALLLVKSFDKTLDSLPKKTHLIIIGDGEEKIEIENYIKQNKLQKRVLLPGHISDYEIIKSHYNTSLLSVSPGYVGLSITQSLGFGVPMLISKNENHSPELEAANHKNALFFETNNIEDLSNKLLNVFEEKDEWLKKRSKISKECAQNYSIEKMGKTFLEAFKPN